MFLVRKLVFAELDFIGVQASELSDPVQDHRIFSVIDQMKEVLQG